MNWVDDLFRMTMSPMAITISHPSLNVLGKKHTLTNISTRKSMAGMSAASISHPSEINGIQTDLQNATIKQICEYPYFIYIAVRDIEPGEESGPVTAPTTITAIS